MSLKQRAVQCSGYIPADQYVPVYSRPHGTNHARWHEEIAPITPRPTLDDPYDNRKHSIHEAVKQWLESSPNSVIGPLYRTRSPSTSSPPSNGESLEKTPARAETPPWESSDMDRFYDVLSGGLSPNQQVSPRQVSIEHSAALVSGSSKSSPKPADRANSSIHWINTYTNRALDQPKQRRGVESPEHGRNGRESRKANDGILPFVPRAAVNEALSGEEEVSGEAEEGPNIARSPALSWKRGGKKRNIAELKSPDQDRLYGLSGELSSNYTSRSASREFDNELVSREFDNELALAVQEIDNSNAVDALSCSSFNSSVGEPVVLLKPPRGQEQMASPTAEQKLTVAKLSPLSLAPIAGDDHNYEVMKLPPLFPRAASAREDQKLVIRRFPPSQRAADPENTNGVLGGPRTSNSEIVPIGDPEIVENGFSDKEKSIEDKPKLLNGDHGMEQKKLGFRATLKKIDESRLESWSQNKTSDAPRLTIKAVLEREQKFSDELGLVANSPVLSNGVATVRGGGLELRHERSSRRPQSSYSSGGSVVSAANSVPSQYIYRVSPPHEMTRKATRSRKLSPNAVAPEESPELKRDKSTKSNQSTESERSRKRADREKAKLEELRLKAEAWENAKNAAILNRYNRRELKIQAWEERKVANATVRLSKLESDLEKKKAKAAEKMQNDVARAHKKAAEMKAQAEAKRAARAAKAAIQAQVIRVMGRSPLSCFRS